MSSEKAGRPATVGLPFFTAPGRRSRPHRRRGAACAAGALLALAALPGLPVSASAPTAVVVTPRGPHDDQQPSLAVDPANASRLAIAYVDVVDAAAEHLPGEQLRSCGLALSDDGGQTWRARVLIGGVPGARIPVPEGFTACGNPAVAYGPDSTLYYLAQTWFQPGDPYSHVMLAASRDGGGSFDAPVNVDAEVPARSDRRGGGDWWPAISVDGHTGTVVVAWTRTTPLLATSSVLTARSSDHGARFSSPVRASSDKEFDVSAPQTALGPRSALYLAWLDETQWASVDLDLCPTCIPQARVLQQLAGYDRQQAARLDDTIGGVGCGGVLFGGDTLTEGGHCELPAELRAAVSPAGGSPDERPAIGSGVGLGCPERVQVPHCGRLVYSFYDHRPFSIAAGTAPGQVVVAWWDAGEALSSSPGLGRLHVADSSDGGHTWQESAGVGVPQGRAQDEQHRPAVSVAPDGRVDVVYYDVAPDGAQEVYWSSAPRAGAGFGQPVKLSAQPSDTTIGPHTDEGRAGFGEHLAAVASAGSVLAAWTDASAGRDHQVIVFTSAPVESGSGGAGIAAPALAAAAALGVVLVTVLVRRRGA